MDALSSMGTICGYKAVLIAADTLPRIFPMLTTAAGTITPGRVLVIGAGVAGLQAIATARRLGAVTSAYDLRPAAKEQVQSLGGRFVELPIEAKDAEDARGYAKAHRQVCIGRVGAIECRFSAQRRGCREGDLNNRGIHRHLAGWPISKATTVNAANWVRSAREARCRTSSEVRQLARLITNSPRLREPAK